MAPGPKLKKDFPQLMFAMLMGCR